jgi:hypothetical protein
VGFYPWNETFHDDPYICKGRFEKDRPHLSLVSQTQIYYSRPCALAQAIRINGVNTHAVGDLLGFDDEKAKVFEIFIQLGAILSVVWLYRERIFRVIKGLQSSAKDRSLAMNVVIAFLPAVFIGLLAHKTIKKGDRGY